MKNKTKNDLKSSQTQSQLAAAAAERAGVLRAASKRKIVKLRADELASHPIAQREIVNPHLKYLIDNLNLDAIGVLAAVEYPIKGQNKVWIVDGHHRQAALLAHGFGEWIVDVEIYTDIKDDAGACALFWRLNKKATVRPFDNFRNQRIAGVPDAVGVHRIAHEHGLIVSPQGADEHITCISALRRIFNLDNGETLKRTLDVILAAWGYTAAAVEGKIVEGVGLVLERYNGAIDQAVLIKKLAKYPGGCSGLIGDARGLREFEKINVARCVSKRIIDHYNLGRHAGKLDPL